MQGMFIIDVTATQRYEMKLLISKTERFIRYYRLLISDNRLITFPKHFIHKQNWNHWFLRYIYIQTYIITINYTNHKRKLFFFLFTPLKYFNQSGFSPFERDKKSKIIVKYKNPIISSPIIPTEDKTKKFETLGKEGARDKTRALESAAPESKGATRGWWSFVLGSWLRRSARG